jgi:hypothetical protein
LDHLKVAESKAVGKAATYSVHRKSGPVLMSNISVKFRGLENLTAEISLEKMLKDNSTFSYTVFYEKDPTNYLAELCDKYGCDKGEIKTTGHPYPWPAHTYADFISTRFGHCRETIRRVFECGLGTNNPSLPANMGPQGFVRGRAN